MHHSRVGVQIAVLRETEAAGPYCSLVMAVVVVKDVLVFVAFAANLEVVSAVRNRKTPLPSAMPPVPCFSDHVCQCSLCF